MRLLLDTDAFCKLGAGGLLQSAAAILGVAWPECLRLPALPQMLRRGRLWRSLGDALCADLLPLAEGLSAVSAAPSDYLDQLSNLTAVDPGEAQLLAHVAASGDLLLTGDKRALRVVKDLPGLTAALAGKIVLPEAILLALCIQSGDDQIRTAMAPALVLDTMLRTCFSAGNPAPRAGLASYWGCSVRELAPLVLWSPGVVGAP
jgi:hypothetical protein